MSFTNCGSRVAGDSFKLIVRLVENSIQFLQMKEIYIKKESCRDRSLYLNTAPFSPHQSAAPVRLEVTTGVTSVQ
jgi:hypothetical protein